MQHPLEVCDFLLLNHERKSNLVSLLKKTSCSQEKGDTITAEEGVQAELTEPNPKEDEVHDADANPLDSKQSPNAAEVHRENAIVSHGSNPSGTDGHEQTEPTDLVMTSIGQNLPPPTPVDAFHWLGRKSKKWLRTRKWCCKLN